MLTWVITRIKIYHILKNFGIIYPEGWNYLSMQRVDGVVSVYVNSVLVGEVASDHFPTGRIGLGGATYDLESITICLDDLRVWRLE